jgi:protein-tyrosine-phosphatase
MAVPSDLVRRGTPPRILFACVGNSARSIMAEAFARVLGAGAVVVKSGGSRPLGHVLPETVAAMAEVGIDVSKARSQPIDEEFVRGADLVVTMGCGEDACPAFRGVAIEDWELPDPKGGGMEAFRIVRDEIEAHVKDLLRRFSVLQPRAPVAQYAVT